MDPRYGHNVKFYIILIERSKFIVKKVAKKDDLLVTTPAVHAVYKSGSLQAGLFELPVMLDPPSAENRLSSTDNNHPNAKWVDNKVSNTKYVSNVSELQRAYNTPECPNFSFHRNRSSRWS